MPSKKKKYNARFPAGRIKKIMQTDEEVGKVAQAVPVIISHNGGEIASCVIAYNGGEDECAEEERDWDRGPRHLPRRSRARRAVIRWHKGEECTIPRTLELFVESLLTKAMEITSAKNAKTLTPSHMKKCILSEQRFDFLKDLVKSVQDSANGEDDVATMSSGLLTPPTFSHSSVPERRKSSSSIVKDEPIIKEETVVKEEQSIKEEIQDPAQVVANCSTLHLRPNFYAETMEEQTVSIHQPPVVGGYHPHPYQDPNGLNRSPVLVMDEDYDT